MPFILEASLHYMCLVFCIYYRKFILTRGIVQPKRLFGRLWENNRKKSKLRYCPIKSGLSNYISDPLGVFSSKM